MQKTIDFYRGLTKDELKNHLVGLGFEFNPKEQMNDQRSLYDQLKDLYIVANLCGLYDAADFVREHIENIEEPMKRDKEIGQWWSDFINTIGESKVER